LSEGLFITQVAYILLVFFSEPWLAALLSLMARPGDHKRRDLNEQKRDSIDALIRFAWEFIAHSAVEKIPNFRLVFFALAYDIFSAFWHCVNGGQNIRYLYRCSKYVNTIYWMMSAGNVSSGCCILPGA